MWSKLGRCPEWQKSRNPNRLLKSLNAHRRHVLKYGWHLTQLFVFLCQVEGWLALECWWRNNVGGQSRWDDQVHCGVAYVLVEDADGAGSTAMQLIILWIMFYLQLLFEFVQWREMSSCSRPPKPGLAEDGSMRAWDPRRDALNWSSRLCGLPSVWFSSKEVQSELNDHINKVNPGQDGCKVWLEELAVYALAGEAERQELSRTLKYAKMYDANDPDFEEMTKQKPLDIELCLFDSKARHRDKNNELCRNLGELVYWQAEEECTDAGAPLRHRPSATGDAMYLKDLCRTSAEISV